LVDTDLGPDRGRLNISESAALAVPWTVAGPGLGDLGPLAGFEPKDRDLTPDRGRLLAVVAVSGEHLLGECVEAMS
jgi:hypothetical protein